MKHAKKVKFTVETPRPDPLLEQFNDIDDEIDKILKNKSLTQSEKLKLYQQLTNKYLIVDNKMNKNVRTKQEIIDNDRNTVDDIDENKFLVPRSSTRIYFPLSDDSSYHETWSYNDKSKLADISKLNDTKGDNSLADVSQQSLNNISTSSQKKKLTQKVSDLFSNIHSPECFKNWNKF